MATILFRIAPVDPDFDDAFIEAASSGRSGVRRNLRSSFATFASVITIEMSSLAHATVTPSRLSSEPTQAKAFQYGLVLAVCDPCGFGATRDPAFFCRLLPIAGRRQAPRPPTTRTHASDTDEQHDAQDI
jgi:hypothetical protein